VQVGPSTISEDSQQKQQEQEQEQDSLAEGVQQVEGQQEDMQHPGMLTQQASISTLLCALTPHATATCCVSPDCTCFTCLGGWTIFCSAQGISERLGT
jgi:hypothetical protein